MGEMLKVHFDLFTTLLTCFFSICLQVNTGLRDLDLGDNGIEAKGAGYLAEALKVHSYHSLLVTT